jgi:hypothetical protein
LKKRQGNFSNWHLELFACLRGVAVIAALLRLFLDADPVRCFSVPATNSSCTPNSWREWVINTPAANRVQHASNSENLDNNSGGVLLIWDHFLDRIRPSARTCNPLRPRPSAPVKQSFVVAYEDFWQMIKEVWRCQYR